MKVEETIEMKFFWSEKEVNIILENMAKERIKAQGFRSLSKTGHHDAAGFSQNYTVKLITDDGVFPKSFELEEIKS